MWITVGVIVLIVVGLSLAQYFGDAGSRIICIMPRNQAKGNRIKNIKTTRGDDREHAETDKQQAT